MTQRLDVLLDFGAGTTPRPVGQLGRDPARRVTVFEWADDFAQAPLPLSPFTVRNHTGLLRPNAERRASLPGLFEDSLPDGWGRLLLDHEMDARGISRSEIGDLDRLAFIGRHGAGALSYIPETGNTELQDIDLAWFESIIPRVDDGIPADELTRLRTMSGGSQGARPKFVAQFDPETHRLRDHRMPASSRWRHILIKARASSDPQGAVEAEIAYGAAMKAAGIEVSPIFPLEAEREVFFATGRFDRPGSGPDSGRLHVATMAGLIDSGMAHGVADYADLVKLAKLLCRDAMAVEEVFRRMVFNARAFNRDDHVRNHAFLMDMDGNWRLAPAYDVSFSDGPGGEHSIAIGGEGRFPGRAAFEKVAHLAGIKPRRRDTIIDEVDAALARWPDFADSHGVPPALSKRIASELANARGWD